MNPEINIKPEKIHQALKITKEIKHSYNSLIKSIGTLNLEKYHGISSFAIWKVKNAANLTTKNIFEEIESKLETFKKQLITIDSSLEELFNTLDNNSIEEFGNFNDMHSDKLNFLGETIQEWKILENGVKIITETATIMIPNEITVSTKMHVHVNGTGGAGKEAAVNFYDEIYNDKNNSAQTLPISIVINRKPFYNPGYDVNEYIPSKDGGDGTEEIASYIGQIAQNYNIDYNRMIFSGYSRGCSSIMQIQDVYYNKYIANQEQSITKISTSNNNKAQLILLAQPENMVIKNEEYFKNAANQGIEITAIYDSNMCTIHQGSSNVYRNSEIQGTQIQVYETTYNHEKLPGYAFGYEGYIGKKIFNQEISDSLTNHKLQFNQDSNRYTVMEKQEKSI